MVGTYRIEAFYIFLQNKKKCKHVKKIVACFGASLPSSLWEASKGNYFSGTRIKKQFRLQARMFFIQKSGSLCKPTLIKNLLYKYVFLANVLAEPEFPYEALWLMVFMICTMAMWILNNGSIKHTQEDLFIMT